MEKEATKGGPAIQSLIIDILIAVLIFCTITAFIKPTVVRGDSMDSTLTNGDYVITLRHAYDKNEPKQGDVVVFKSPIEDVFYIKRVIATPGQHVRIENGSVYVDDRKLKESYIGGQKTDGDADLTVPENEIFVLGDNREVSLDSRTFGCISEDTLEGKTVLRLFPKTGTVH